MRTIKSIITRQIPPINLLSRSNSFTITKEEETDWQISHVLKFNPPPEEGCNKIVKSIGRLIEGRLVVSRVK